MPQQTLDNYLKSYKKTLASIEAQQNPPSNPPLGSALNPIDIDNYNDSDIEEIYYTPNNYVYDSQDETDPNDLPPHSSIKTLPPIIITPENSVLKRRLAELAAKRNY